MGQVVALRQVGILEIAPSPRLAGLDRSDERMSCLLMVPPSVLQLRTVTTTWETAYQAHADMDPTCTDFEAG